MENRATKYFILLAVSVVFIMVVGRLSAVGWLAPTNNPPNNGDIAPIEANGEDGLGSHIATLNLNMSNKLVVGLGAGSGWALQATSTVAAPTLQVTVTGSGRAIAAQSTATDIPALRIYNPNGYALQLQSVGGALYVEKNLRISNGGAGVGGLNWQDSVLWTSPGVVKGKSLYWGKDIVCDGTKADCGRQSVVGAGDNLGVVTTGGHTAAYYLDMASNRIYGIGDDPGTGHVLPSAPPDVSLSAKNTAVVAGGAALNTISDKSYGLAVQSTSQGGGAFASGSVTTVSDVSTDAVIYHDKLYVSLYDDNVNGYDLMEHSGNDPTKNWVYKKSKSDFGASCTAMALPLNGAFISSLAVHNDKLYAALGGFLTGVSSKTVNQELYIYNANDNSQQCIDLPFTNFNLVDYDGYLYALVEIGSNQCGLKRTTDGTTWSDAPVPVINNCNGGVNAVTQVYNGKLYIFTSKGVASDLALYAYDGSAVADLDPSSYLNHWGSSVNRGPLVFWRNKIYVDDIDGIKIYDLATGDWSLMLVTFRPRMMFVYQDQLFSVDADASIWQYSGISWTQITSIASGNYLLAPGVVYNGSAFIFSQPITQYLTFPQSYGAYAYNSGNGYGLVGSNVSSPGGLFYGQTMVATDDTALVEPQVTFGADNNRLSVLRATDALTASIYWGNTKLCDMNQPNDCFGALSGVQLWTKTADNDLWTDSLTSIGGQTRTAKLEVMPKASVLSSVTLAGITATKFQVQGDYLYTVRGSGPSFMEIWNIANPAVPTQVGTALQINASLAVNDFKVAGNYAYFVVGVNGSAGNRLIVVNISNPASPGAATAVFTFPSTEEPTAIEISGILAMVGTHWRTFALDISKPLTPVELSRKEYEASGNSNSVDDIAISGDYAYVVANAEKMHVYDISNPKNMTVTHYVPASFSPTKIYIYGNYAFVSNGSTGLQVLNISNPGVITKVDEIPLADATYGLEVVGHYLFTSSATGLLGVWDISKLGSLSSESFSNVLVGTTGTGGRGILVRGSKVFALKSDNTVSLVNIGGTNFQTLKVGSLSSDNVYVSTGISRADSIYAGNGLIAGGNLTVNKGSLISTKGVIKIGATELTKARLVELLAWLASMGY